MYIRKKRGKKPRPIRVGELWRRVIAKRLVFVHQSNIASVCRQARQFGVGFPGGADILIHMRLVFEKVCRESAVENVWDLLNIDFQNVFPSIEGESTVKHSTLYYPSCRRGVLGAMKLQRILFYRLGILVFVTGGQNKVTL